MTSSSPLLGHRNFVEIVRDILLACRKEAVGKTAIMYGSRLSFKQLQSYLPLLLAKNLIQEDVAGRFSITASGEKGLRTVTRASNFIQTLRD